MEIEEQTVELIQKSFAGAVSINANVYYSLYLKEEILRWTVSMFVQEVENIEYKWPENWIEALKERFAPQWLKNKWPVKYTIKGHKVMIHYPDIAVKNKDYKIMCIKN